MNSSCNLFLASKSPRRRELLDQIGVKYSLLDVDVPECLSPGELPHDYVLRLAQSKALAGVAALDGGVDHSVPVMGADTIVVCRGNILEKPGNEVEGVAMLMTLSGAEHSVVTAICLATPQGSKALLSETRVLFRNIDQEEARRYWLTGEPKDKAGGYGIQGYGAVFVEKIEGSYSNVVGLPLFETQNLLKEFSVPIWN